MTKLIAMKNRVVIRDVAGTIYNFHNTTVEEVLKMIDNTKPLEYQFIGNLSGGVVSAKHIVSIYQQDIV